MDIMAQVQIQNGREVDTQLDVVVDARLREFVESDFEELLLSMMMMLLPMKMT
jgi:hypothetical protein